MPTLTVMNSLILAALLPLAGFFLLLFWGRRFGRDGRAAGSVGMLLAVASFALSITALVFWVAKDGFKAANYVEAFTYRWVNLPADPAPQAQGLPSLGLPRIPESTLTTPAGPDAITVGCVIDSLTIVMFVILTLMNVLVHMFALGSAPPRPQMAVPGERRGGGPRFFALLQFFNFALLGFLLANSLVQLLAFWEILGVAAFFLVRLSCRSDQQREILSAASLRMFLMFALGDAALFLGVGILLLHTGTLAGLAFSDARGASILSATVREAMNVQSSEYLRMPGTGGFLDMHWLTWVSICFLTAALTRMAQFPFQTWVHDVAQTPTPVATLVLGTSTLAAGTFLLARVCPLLTIDARFIAAVIGCVTLVTAALVALVQTDIRQILAWSTVSQGGYVLLFLGSGGYAAGLLHLFTHMFIKTALFLAAGSVLYGLASGTSQGVPATADIRHMGGLWKRFPITAVAALLAVLSLAGVPYLSGAYATNLGLACAWDYAQALRGTTTGYEWWLVGIPTLATYLTAFGIGRWWWLIFAGTNRNPKLYEIAHETPFLTLPVILLGVLTIGLSFEFSGVFLPLIMKSIPEMQLSFVVEGSEAAKAAVIPRTGWAFIGLLAAAVIYWHGFDLAKRLRRLPGVGWLDYWLRERMFLDELYEGVLLTAVFFLARIVHTVEWLIRGSVKLLSALLWLAAAGISRIEKAASPPPPAPPPPESQVAS